MRADRLLSILMLLQSRRRMTAQELAEELEVSVRTIYRDMEALGTAGVPIYSERGPGGGWALLDSYRTTLTGLTRDEVRALFMLGVPAALADLGLDRELRAAMFKLSAALPPSRRGDEERVRQRIHLDPVGWSDTNEPVPHLQIVQQALWADRKLLVTLRLAFESQVQWLVEPYGLVSKAGAWYLVCGRDDQIRVLRLSKVLNACLSEESFQRPTDLDLRAYWRTWCVAYEGNRPRYPVVVRVAPALLPFLPQHFGDQIREAMAAAGPPDAEGWLALFLTFEDLAEARGRILAFGGAMEVLAPRALRSTVADYATQTRALYVDRSAGQVPDDQRIRTGEAMALGSQVP